MTKADIRTLIAKLTAGLSILLSPFPTLAGTKRQLQITVSFKPPETCLISFQDQTFSLRRDEDKIIELLKTLRRVWSSAKINGGVEIPYMCLGHATYAAQRAGFKKVGFVAEPPSGESDESIR